MHASPGAPPWPNNCLPPCRVDPDDLERFLAVVPGNAGRRDFSLLFTQQGATVTVDGQRIGVVPNRQFAEAMLATFLGPARRHRG